MPTGEVQFTIADGGGGNVVVPSSQVQVVIGCAAAGTATQVVATRSLSTLQSTFTSGPLVEAAGLSVLAGGTVLAIRAATQTPGSQRAVTFAGTGTSVITTSGNAVDEFYVVFKVITGGTIAVAGIIFQISIDGGRSFGPAVALGTANSYVIPGTGITLNFGAGTLVANDQATFSSIAPIWNNAGAQACLNSLQASPYAITGWGSMHIVGICAGADATVYQGYLDTLANGYLFTRTFLAARDASPASKWGGTGESDATWATSIGTDFSAVSARRVCVGAGNYNMPSAFPNSLLGAWRPRRNLSWAAAARQVQIKPQQHLGRVSFGSLSQIIVDPSNDPTDGFVYHDERLNPGLDYLINGTGSRFMAARTRTQQGAGFFITNPLSMAPLGSDFYLKPYGDVMDIACNVVHQVGAKIINADIRLNIPAGTIYENDAKSIERTLTAAINDQMTSKNMISGVLVVVDRTNNINTTKVVKVTVTIYARGYVLEEDVLIGFQNPAAAA